LAQIAKIVIITLTPEHFRLHVATDRAVGHLFVGVVVAEDGDLLQSALQSDFFLLLEKMRSVEISGHEIAARIRVSFRSRFFGLFFSGKRFEKCFSP
jgi:hypothetical protein